MHMLCLSENGAESLAEDSCTFDSLRIFFVCALQSYREMTQNTCRDNIYIKTSKNLYKKIQQFPNNTV